MQTHLLVMPSKHLQREAYATITAPIYFPKLLRAILQKLQDFVGARLT